MSISTITADHPDKLVLPGPLNSEKHISALDGLRGMAILLVVAFHYFYYAVPVFAVGWVGVDLFFVLSGYLITKRLIENKDRKDRYKLFYTNRALRIMPLYYLVLILFYSSIYFLVEPQNFHRFDFYLNNKVDFFLFLQNGVFVKSMPLEPHLGHLWSLAIEEQFYLAWPLILYTFYKKKHFINILWLSIIAVLILRNILYFTDHLHKNTYYKHTFCRIDSIIIGALTYFLLLKPTNAKLLKWVGIIALLFVCTGLFVLQNAAPSSPFSTTVGYTAYAFLFASVLGHVISYPNSKIARFFKLSFLRFTGKISYGFYVIHVLVGVTLAVKIKNALQPAFPNWAKDISWIICFAVSYLLSIVSYYYFESFFLKFKK